MISIPYMNSTWLEELQRTNIILKIAYLKHNRQEKLNFDVKRKAKLQNQKSNSNHIS